MYKFLVFAFLVSCLSPVYSQIAIPDFESNATKKDSIEIQHVLKATRHFNPCIILEVSSWGYQSYLVIGYKGGHWHKVKVLKRYIRFIKLFQHYKTVEAESKDSILNRELDSLSNKHLFSMNARAQDSTIATKPDSLNSKYRQMPFFVSDGIGYTFIIKSGRKLRIINSYAPDAYFIEYPEIIDRKYFSDCVSVFDNLFFNNH